MDKNNPDWMTGGPWYNTSICEKIHGKVFEEFIRDSRTYRYNIMCYIYAHEKNNSSENNDGIRSGGYPIELNATTEALVSLSATINIIGYWL